MVSLTQLGELAAAVLFVIWAAVLLWHLFGRLLRPMRGERIWMLLPGEGDGEGLEATLRWLAWCREGGVFRGWAVIFDRSLTPQGRELALNLARRWNWVSCCPAGSLEEWLSQDEEP